MGQRSRDEFLKAFVEEIFPFYQEFQIEISPFKKDEFIQCLNEISSCNCQEVNESYEDFVKAVSVKLFMEGSFFKNTSKTFPFKAVFPKELSKKKILDLVDHQNDFFDYSEYSLMYNKYRITYDDLKKIIRNNNININRRLRELN